MSAILTYHQLGQYGRLGNQMYQIASTIGVAVKNNCDYVFPPWAYSKYFKEPVPQFKYGVPFINRAINEGSNLNYQNIVIKETEGITNLMGYWQSYKYFDHCKDLIKRYFTFTDEVYKKADLLEENLCSIHVRRGDYVNLQDFHPVQSMNYYHEAIFFVRNISNDRNLKFVVMSDDIQWCKENFKGDEFIFREGTNEIEDLALQTLCDYHIIANSSFSWWGAYLADSKITIAPKNWFGKNIPNGDLDRIPEGWIRL